MFDKALIVLELKDGKTPGIGAVQSYDTLKEFVVEEIRMPDLPGKEGRNEWVSAVYKATNTGIGNTRGAELINGVMTTGLLHHPYFPLAGCTDKFVRFDAINWHH